MKDRVLEENLTARIRNLEFRSNMGRQGIVGVAKAHKSRRRREDYRSVLCDKVNMLARKLASAYLRNDSVRGEPK